MLKHSIIITIIITIVLIIIILLDRTLHENVFQRSNIFEVLSKVCELQKRPCPIENVSSLLFFLFSFVTNFFLFLALHSPPFPGNDHSF